MSKSGYSKELVNLVKQFLIKSDWRFSFDEEEGMFGFGLRIKNKLQRIDYVVNVCENEILFYGLCPIYADCNDIDMMTRLAEFFCRINYGLRNGCFEFDFRDGEIGFKSFIDCDGFMPSNEVIKNSIHCTVAMYKIYAPGIIAIIFSGCTAKEAMVQCEKAIEDELCSRLAKVTEEDVKDADAGKLLERLEARLGICRSGDDESDEVLEDFSDEICVDPFEGKKEGGAV